MKYGNYGGEAQRIMRAFAIAGILGILTCGTARILASQTQPTTVERKVVTRLQPEYPETLKRLYIGGVVRVEVVVGANGSVQTTELLGGNPILGQSAMKAIKQWKYAPAAGKEKLVVQLEFDPHR
jgi:TonB family protein